MEILTTGWMLHCVAVMEKWVTFGYTTKFPFTVLFHPQWEYGAGKWNN